MGRRESSLESWAVKWARVRGIVVAKLAQVDGIPDRVFFVPGGRPVVGEFKAEGGGSGGLQELTQPWYLARLTELGYRAHRWDSKEAFLETMRGYEKCRMKK